jgi:hypothetical protein
MAKASRTIAKKQSRLFPRIEEARAYVQELLLRGVPSNRAILDAAQKFDVHPATLGGSTLKSQL